MVIAKLSIAENCYLLSTKESHELAFIFILSMGENALFPSVFPARIYTGNI